MEEAKMWINNEYHYTYYESRYALWSDIYPVIQSIEKNETATDNEKLLARICHDLFLRILDLEGTISE